jgi:hypothetical protein
MVSLPHPKRPLDHSRRAFGELGPGFNPNYRLKGHSNKLSLPAAKSLGKDQPTPKRGARGQGFPADLKLLERFKQLLV